MVCYQPNVMERLATLNYRYYARDVCKLLLGTVLQTAAYAFVMVPLRVVNGGVTSFSLVLHGVTGLDVVVLANILLMFLVVLAWLGLGRECMVKSLLGCVFYAWSFSLFLAMEWSLDWPLPLGVVLAAVSVGTGYYLCMDARGSSMGFDVVALILNRKNPRVRIAVAMRTINVAVILAGFAVFGLESVAAGIIFTMIQTWVLGLWIKLRPPSLRD